jgi:hypothetical protein
MHDQGSPSLWWLRRAKSLASALVDVQHWLAVIEQPEFKASLIGRPKKQTSNGIKTFSQKNDSRSYI